MNGLEVMEESKDEEMKTFAMDLIKKSSKTASAKLQFCRIAFGAAGSAGAQIDTGDAEKVARGMLEDDKTKLDWQVPRVLSPKNRVKLLLNMLLVAGQAIPRGGRWSFPEPAKARPWSSASSPRGRTPAFRRRLWDCSPASRRRAIASMLMPSSPSTPDCWPGTAGLPWPWRPRARRL